MVVAGAVVAGAVVTVVSVVAVVCAGTSAPAAPTKATASTTAAAAAISWPAITRFSLAEVASSRPNPPSAH
jgi:hypothetical protein